MYLCKKAIQHAAKYFFFFDILEVYIIILVTPSRCFSTPKFIRLPFACSILFFLLLTFVKIKFDSNLYSNILGCSVWAKVPSRIVNSNGKFENILLKFEQEILKFCRKKNKFLLISFPITTIHPTKYVYTSVSIEKKEQA